MEPENINPTGTETPDTPDDDKQNAATGTAPANDAPAEEPAGEKKPDAPVKKTSGFQKRIKKLVSQKHELKQRLEKAEAELAALKEPPREEDFDDPDEFIAARVDHLTEKKLLEREAKLAKERAQGLDTEAQRAKREVFDTVMREGIAKHPDFFHKVTTCPLPEHVADAALDTPDATETLYYLGTNPIEALDIAKLPPEEAAARVKEIGRKLATTTTTNAPPPLSEPTGATPGGSEPLRDDLPMDEWVKRREAQLYK